MRLLTPSAIVAFLAAVPAYGDGPRGQCKAAEEADSQVSEKLVSYTKADDGWRIVADPLSSEVTIENLVSNSRCRTSVDGLSNVYFTRSEVVLLRSRQISSDDIYFIDGNTCRPTHRALAVYGDSNSRIARRLKALGFCVRFKKGKP